MVGIWGTPPVPAMPATPTMPAADASTSTTATPDDPDKPKEPKAGDFNAGGQARFPSGPDAMGQYASFNWIAADLEARYYLLKTVTIDAKAPLELKKPDTLGGGMVDPKMIGGMSVTLDARRSTRACRSPGRSSSSTRPTSASR